MVKKLMIVCLLACLLATVGCQRNDEITKLVSQKLTQREDYLLKLTGNRMLIYDFRNLPNSVAYEIEVVYQVYEDGVLLKEQPLTAIYNDQTSEKVKGDTLALNIESDEIRYLWGQGGYASGTYNLEEDLSQHSQSWFTGNSELKLGTDIYIYHANSGSSSQGNIELGVAMTNQELTRVLEANKDNIFIKIGLKEIEPK